MEFVDRIEKQKRLQKALNGEICICRCIWQAQVRKIHPDKKSADFK